MTGLALDADCRGHLDDIFEGLHAAERSGIQTLLVRNVINLRQQRWGSGGFAEMADIETPPADKHSNYIILYHIIIILYSMKFFCNFSNTSDCSKWTCTN